jgi:ketosteroid isomerase-like protein
MKKIYLLLAIVAVACQQAPPVTDVKEVMEADRAFSAMCAEKGMGEAFIAFAADDVVKLNPRQKTIMNKQELIESFKKDPEGAQLKFTWEPSKANVSGDIGYTFGQAKIVLPADSTGQSKTLYFDYVTVWKKQKDGSWKYQTDCGNPVPAPEAK